MFNSSAGALQHLFTAAHCFMTAEHFYCSTAAQLQQHIVLLQQHCSTGLMGNGSTVSYDGSTASPQHGSTILRHHCSTLILY
jgi:hypothetical protein